ncbi:VOC family protein [Kitasatospora sp. NPDC052896]|uniref:VOC family protein n=1 Tax=Kitasatospora sp. NPDC052896 TaxID=3364061 RepID=UPI0037C7503D
MPLRRVNHVVLSVSDLDASVHFYRDTLGLRVVTELPGTEHWPAMVFLRSPLASTNHHDLALIANADAPADGVRRPGLFHVAFELGTIDELERAQQRLTAAGTFGTALDQGMHLSVYGTDPDGLAVEVIWRTPDGAWSYDDALSRGPLDYRAARDRWGGDQPTGAAAGVPA